MIALTGLGAWAQEAEDPFKDQVEMRHGLMLQMSTDLAKMGSMAKGETPYDAATAGKAAANIAAIASVLSMDQFPAGSEYGKSADSFALADIWAKQDDFLAKITDLNNAASVMAGSAATDLASISERRIENLVNPDLSGLPGFLTPHPGCPVVGFVLKTTPVAERASHPR